MIPYVEVREKYTRRPFATIEPSECWFELVYYGVGEFEVYTRATRSALESLACGNYITIPQRPFAWVIEHVEKTFEAGRGYMISARGRQAKAILGKRIINRQTQLPNDLTTAVIELIREHAGDKATEARKIDGLTEFTSLVAQPITESQVSYKNLLSYTDELLQTYEAGAELSISDALALGYRIYSGSDRSDYIIFSQTFDNLLSSAYSRNIEAWRTFALIGGQGEGAARVLTTYDAFPSLRGIDRAEIFVDAKDVSNTYTEAGEEKELDLTNAADLATYKGWLIAKGETSLAQNLVVETFEGEIDTNASRYKFGEDFYLGDRVRVQDDRIGVYITPRILKCTIKQDQSYSEIVEFGG